MVLIVLSEVIIHKTPTINLEEYIGYNLETARNVSTVVEYSDKSTFIVVAFEDDEEKFRDFYNTCSTHVKADELKKYSNFIQGAERRIDYDISVDDISNYGVKFKHYRSMSEYFETTVEIHMFQMNQTDNNPRYVFFMIVPERVKV